MSRHPQRTLSNDPQCVYRTRRELFAVLARMRAWAAEGLSDTEISAEIARVRFHNGGHR